MLQGWLKYKFDGKSLLHTKHRRVILYLFLIIAYFLRYTCSTIPQILKNKPSTHLLNYSCTKTNLRPAENDHDWKLQNFDPANLSDHTLNSVTHVVSPGWKMERNQCPDSLHCSILPHHTRVADKFLDDLEEAAKYCRVSDFQYSNNSFCFYSSSV